MEPHTEPVVPQANCHVTALLLVPVTLAANCTVWKVSILETSGNGYGDQHERTPRHRTMSYPKAPATAQDAQQTRTLDHGIIPSPK